VIILVTPAERDTRNSIYRPLDLESIDCKIRSRHWIAYNPWRA